MDFGKLARRPDFSLALTVNLAVYGWLGGLGVWSSKETNRNERLVYLFIAGVFTLLTRLLGTPSFSWFVRSDNPTLVFAEHRYHP